MDNNEIIKKLTDEIQLLKAQLAKYEETIRKLGSTIEILERNEKIYFEALALAKKKQFGSSSEKTPPQEQLGLFNEAEKEYTDNPVEPVVKTPQGIKKREPKSGRERLIDKKLVGTEIVNFTLSAEKEDARHVEKKCAQWGWNLSARKCSSFPPSS